MAAYFWCFHFWPVSCHRTCARLLIGATPSRCQHELGNQDQKCLNIIREDTQSYQRF